MAKDTRIHIGFDMDRIFMYRVYVCVCAPRLMFPYEFAIAYPTHDSP